MQNNELTAGKTAQSYPKSMQIIKNCHWNDNIRIRIHGWLGEMLIRKLCDRNHWYLVNCPDAQAIALLGKGVAA